MKNNWTDFYVNNMSYSQLRTFTTNPGEWQNQKLMWIYDNKRWVAAAVGIILHKFVEIYLTTWNIDEAVSKAHGCLYDWDDKPIL